MVHIQQRTEFSSEQQLTLERIAEVRRTFSSEDFITHTYVPVCDRLLPRQCRKPFMPLSGFSRPVDREIVAEILSRISHTNHDPLRVLEIAAGKTLPNDKAFGSPWLSRTLSCAFPGKLEVTVCEKENTLLTEIESTLFGLNVLPQISFEDISSLKNQYDIIFARHVPQESYMVPHLKSAGGSILEKLTDRGMGIFGTDSEESIRICQYNSAPVSYELIRRSALIYGEGFE